MQVSVLIATRNRASLLRRSLASLARQESGDLQWQVVVIDNGSSDETTQVLQEMSGRLPLLALQEPRPGKNRALNAGLRAVRSELLLFTDDDILFDPGWIKAYWAAALRWPTDDIFCGPIKPEFPPGTPEWIAADDFPYSSTAFARFLLDSGEGPIKCPPFGGNLGIRATVFGHRQYNEAVGPDGSQIYKMGSETELLVRLANDGKRFIYVPDASVHHVITPDQTNESWLVGRAWREGRRRGSALADYEGTWLFGIPRYLWRTLARHLLCVGVAAFRGPHARCLARIELAQLRGIMKETRRIRRGG